MLIKLFFLLTFCLIASSLQSCAHVDVKQMTYKALRQQDCRINEPNTFCERGFSAEYQEYERIRQEYIRDSSSEQYRVDVDKSDLQMETLAAPALMEPRTEAQDIVQ